MNSPGPEIWIAAIYGGILGLAALGQYLNRPKAAVKGDPVVAGYGIGLIERDQAERLLAFQARQASAQERIAEFLGSMSDRDRAELKDELEELKAMLGNVGPKRPGGRRR